jgi:hypothetical protein
MAPKIKENKEFAKWFRDWIAVIQQNRASLERTLPEKTASADGQEHSDGAHLFGPKCGPHPVGTSYEEYPVR